MTFRVYLNVNDGFSYAQVFHVYLILCQVNKQHQLHHSLPYRHLPRGKPFELVSRPQVEARGSKLAVEEVSKQAVAECNLAEGRSTIAKACKAVDMAFAAFEVVASQVTASIEEVSAWEVTSFTRAVTTAGTAWVAAFASVEASVTRLATSQVVIVVIDIEAARLVGGLRFEVADCIRLATRPQWLACP